MRADVLKAKHFLVYVAANSRTKISPFVGVQSQSLFIVLFVRGQQNNIDVQWRSIQWAILWFKKWQLCEWYGSNCWDIQRPLFLASPSSKWHFFSIFKLSSVPCKLFYPNQLAILRRFQQWSKFKHYPLIKNEIIIICCIAGCHMSPTFDKRKLFCSQNYTEVYSVKRITSCLAFPHNLASYLKRYV